MSIGFAALRLIRPRARRSKAPGNMWSSRREATSHMDNGHSGTYVWTCVPDKTITANLMASQTMSSTIGRNDPCVCGSGKKYKRCCQEEGRSATATAASKTTMIVLGAVMLIGLVLIVISLVAGGGESVCPPGQSWSAAHGHCH